MLAIPWPAVSGDLFTPEQAEAAALRHWLADDAGHAVAAVIHGRYDRRDGLHFLITSALHHAGLAKMAPELARSVAVGMFREGLQEQEGRREATTWRIRQRLKPLLVQRKPSNVLFAEAHDVNGLDGFPLGEAEVNNLTKMEMYWAMPAGRRPNVR